MAVEQVQHSSLIGPEGLVPEEQVVDKHLVSLGDEGVIWLGYGVTEPRKKARVLEQHLAARWVSLW